MPFLKMTFGEVTFWKMTRNQSSWDQMLLVVPLLPLPIIIMKAKLEILYSLKCTFANRNQFVFVFECLQLQQE